MNRNINNEIKDLESILEDLIKANEPELLTNLTNIKGIGKKTAMLFIVSTSGFTKFKNARQLSLIFLNAEIFLLNVFSSLTVKAI